jgi:ParB-like chromosome segregation protein Spo0J
LLRTDGSPRLAGEDLTHARALADTPDELPPIIVHRSTMRVIDGMHRLHAAKLRRQHDIAVRYFDGDAADAFVLAVQANVRHGLPLSVADRKAAAARIVASHPRWSNRMIASVVGLSPKTVADVRRYGATQTPAADTRVGRDGRARPMDSQERRQIASTLLRDNPNLSLRQVARTAGISPETARAVRTRLRSGEDPVVSRGHAHRTADTTSAQRDWSSVVRNLQTDPALRFSETGRTLLRLLDMHAISKERWAVIVNNVPPHSRPTIAMMAMECARLWRRVAEHLERDTLV